jgi:hypothetical protein
VLRTACFAGIMGLVALAATTHVRAVAASMTATYSTVTSTYSYTYTYNKADPTDSDIADWQTGWSASGITGWDYVGSDNGASAVYLGDGYVLTAGHVGAHDFILDGHTYDVVSGSTQSIGTADLTLYKIDTTSTTGHLLDLPTLSLQTSAPSVGNSVVMIGYGNSQGETWATDTLYETNQDTPLSPYDSTDFYTVDNFSWDGAHTTITNNGQLVPGDSGGGDFIYDAATGEWQLAGINEVLLINTSGKIAGSGMIQLSQYAATIDEDVPEPPAWSILGLGLVALAAMRRFRVRPAPVRVDAR